MTDELISQTSSSGPQKDGVSLPPVAASLLHTWSFSSFGKPEPESSSWKRRLLRMWIAFGERIGKYTSIILLSVVYLVFFGLARVASILARFDLLRNRPVAPHSYWRPKATAPVTIETSKRQF